MNELPQGDTRLLRHPIAERLLASDVIAQLAYLVDGTPRLFPFLFNWTGEELVLGTFDAPGMDIISGVRANPEVAVIINTNGIPPEVLQLYGRATVTDYSGVLPEYLEAHRRYGGDELAEQTLAKLDHPGTKMARIGIVPSWVGLFDFKTRFPGKITPENFAKLGRD